MGISPSLWPSSLSRVSTRFRLDRWAGKRAPQGHIPLSGTEAGSCSRRPSISASERQEPNDKRLPFCTYNIPFPVWFLRLLLPTPLPPAVVDTPEVALRSPHFSHPPPALARIPIDRVVSGLRGSCCWPRVVIIRVQEVLWIWPHS